ncbi:NAD-dependent epimerase/dehydratase family protein [Vibrio cholerae]|uniref:NAD-dependent epimerase/dehydratase family protein n=1 Tax=Vibrio cholerae TaxID=666 RepID=UPI00215C4174|nr:NAD-dependent epimerase/dehydratase family protein [Vibrio cholerae]MCR9872831.1 NAD-dependent epimerase/dehydratase family protein [Vibrio cholerae]
MIKVLITSVGGGVGQSVVDSISHLKADYYIVGLDLSDRIYSKNQCDKFIVSPRINESSYIDFLMSTCEEYSIDVLIPGHDGELELLSKNIEFFNNKGVAVVVSPTRIVASSRNKFNWYRDYSDIINIVPTALYDEYISYPEKFPDITFPLIAKPSAGSASSGIKIFLTPSELLAGRLPEEESSNYVVQPYLMPRKDDADYFTLENAVNQKRLLQLSEISCQIVYSVHSEVIGIFVSKNSLKNGVPVTIEPVTDRNILSVVEEIAEKLKHEKVVGPVNIQGRLTDDGLVFFEMNLRFTGITGNRSQFGFNEVSSVIDSFVYPDEPVKLLSLNTSRVGARQVACSTAYPSTNRTARTIFITGAGSWAARNLVDYLSRNGLLLDKKLILSSRDPYALQDITNKRLGAYLKIDNIEFIGVSDIELAKAIGLSDVVINYASARPPHGAQSIFDTTTFNLSLVDLLKKGNVGLVINMSSQSVYDSSSNTCCSENALLSPDTPYSISKLTVENLFASIPRFTRCTDVVNLRLGRLWGGVLDIDKSQFPFRLLSAALGNGEFTISNSKNLMSMLDVDDLSATVVKLIFNWESQKTLPEILNLGGVNTSLEGLLSSLEHVLRDKQLQSHTVPVLNDHIATSTFTISSKLAETLQLISTSDLDVTWRKLIRTYLGNKSYK